MKDFARKASLLSVDNYCKQKSELLLYGVKRRTDKTHLCILDPETKRWEDVAERKPSDLEVNEDHSSFQCSFLQVVMGRIARYLAKRETKQ